MKLLRYAAVLVGLSCCGVLVAAIATGHAPVDRESIWSIAVVAVDSPFDLKEKVANIPPSITSADVTDVHARFVADPFMVRHDGRWVMFFEVLNDATDQGDIGYATSSDGKVWSYQRIVLDELFHLSYPSVFEYEGEFYMVPESEAAGSVRLYRATAFPSKWEYDRTLISGSDLADPTIIHHDGGWFMSIELDACCIWPEALSARKRCNCRCSSRVSWASCCCRFLSLWSMRRRCCSSCS